MIVYKCTNLVNGKIYIGQTIRTLKIRKYEHSRSIRSLIGKAIKKYGIDNFMFEIIDTARDMKELNDLEVKYISELKSIAPAGYNLKEGGDNKITHLNTIKKIKATKQFPIDCKCLVTGVTFSFKNSSEVVSIGVKSANVVTALNRGRISSGFYWKRRDEDFPEDVKLFAYENKRRGSGSSKGKKLSSVHRDKVVKSLNEFRNCPYRKESAKEAIIKNTGVSIVDSNGVVYETLAEASRITGASRSNIRKVIKGERSHSAGLVFQYYKGVL